MENLPEDSIRELIYYLDYPSLVSLIKANPAYGKLADKYVLKEISKKYSVEECIEKNYLICYANKAPPKLASMVLYLIIL